MTATFAQSGDTRRDGAIALAACAATGLDLRGGSSGKAALRRTVGPKLKDESLGVALRFLDECAPLEKAVKDIDAAAVRVVQGCVEVQYELSRVEAEATAYLEVEEQLQREIGAIRDRRDAVSEFVQAVTFNDEQRLSLTRPLDGAALAAAASLGETQVSQSPTASAMEAHLPVVEAAEAFLVSLAAVNHMRKRCWAGQEAGMVAAASQQDSALAELETQAAMTAFNAVKDAAPGMSRNFSAGSRAGVALRGLVTALAVNSELLQACVEVVTACRKRALTRLLVRSLARGEQQLRSGSRQGTAVFGSGAESSGGGGGVGDLAMAGMLGEGSQMVVSSGLAAADGSSAAEGVAADLPDVLVVDVEMGPAAASGLLAWCHQGLAAERETMLSLFGGLRSDEPAPAADPAATTAAAGVAETTSRTSPSVFDELQIVSTVANGLSSPVRVRLEQIVERCPMSDPKALFAVSDVTAFFAVVISRITGSASGLPGTLATTAGVARARFLEAVAAWASRSVGGIPRLPASLSAPDAVTSTAAGLAALCRLPEASMSGQDAGEALGVSAALVPASADAIASAALEPIIKAVNSCGNGMGVTEHALWMANALDSLVSAVKGVPGVASVVSDLVAQRSYHTDTVVQAMINSTLSSCGLLGLLRAAESHDPSATDAAPLSSQPAFADTAAVRDAVSRFVAHCTALPAGSAAHLDNPRLRAEVRAAVSAVLVAAYETLATAIADPRNRFTGDAASLLPHTVADFRTLVE